MIDFKRIVVALDYDDENELLGLVDQLDPALCRLKIGKQSFTRFGPDIVRQLVKRDFDIFLDLKFHDIPNTVAKAVSAAADLGVWMVNVHAMGGAGMMTAAREALETFGNERPLLIAVTVLTSMSDNELMSLQLPKAESLVPQLASLANDNKLDGVVCSAVEAGMIKQRCGQSFVTVTPGIRPAGSAADDQHRIMTPGKAVASGADYLVVGRPITLAEDPLMALQAIHKEIENA